MPKPGTIAGITTPHKWSCFGKMLLVWKSLSTSSAVLTLLVGSLVLLIVHPHLNLRNHLTMLLPLLERSAGITTNSARRHRNAKPLRLEVKLQGWSLAATNVAGLSSTGRLFYIHDSLTLANLRFLVDTGTQISIVPPTHKERSAGASNMLLKAINGSEIPIFGMRSLTLDIGLRRTFRWVFVVADIPHANLGADFLYHFGLLVSLCNHALCDSTTHFSVQGVVCTNTSSSGLARHQVNPSDPYSQLLSKFPSDVTQASFSDLPVKHTVTHHIQTTGPAVAARTRRLAPESLRIAKQEFDHMLQ